MKSKNYSLHSKLIRGMLLGTIIPMIIAPIIGYVYTRDVLLNNTQIVTDQLLENIDQSINHVIDDIISASNVVALDDVIQEVLLSPPNSIIDKIYREKIVLERLHYMEASNLYPYMVESTIVTFDNEIYTTSFEMYPDIEKIVKSDWYIESLNNNGFFIWKAPSNNIMDYEGGITLVRLLTKNYYQQAGVLLIHLFPSSSLSDILQRDSELNGTQRCIINETGDTILKSNNDYVYSKEEILKIATKKGVIDTTHGKMYVGTKKIQKTNWTLIQLVPYEIIIAEVKNYRNGLLIVNIIGIIFLLSIIIYTSFKESKGVRQLVLSVNEISHGNLDVNIEAVGSKEIIMLKDNMNYMVRALKESMMRVELETKQKEEAKLKSLQAQINPHFLLNTLNGIKWFCVIENAKNSEKMIKQLGYLLENTLGKFDDFITLEKEVDLLKSYIDIQKMRYGKRIKVCYELDAKTLKAKVPVLLLQPIVENSIIHGFDEEQQDGVIIIRSIHKIDYIEIWIEDNGKGMTPEEEKRIFENKKSTERFSSIGIRNVKERIELYYEPPCGLGIETELGTGTKTILLIKNKEQE
ncbi:sensor histidine kinase [Vallitaleaceae bacterium 9-2]